MRTKLGFAAAMLAAACAWLCAGTAGAQPVNVSKIATGVQTNLNFTASAMQPKVVGATIGYFTMATAKIDSEPDTWFVTAPWTAAMAAAPDYPMIVRQGANAPYPQGGAQFGWDSSIARRGQVNMAVAPPKTVDAYTATKGAAVAGSTVTYRVRIDHTMVSSALDYYIDLQIPERKRTTNIAYNLCCSGDSNGGTYNYLRPKYAYERANVDVYADGLPVFSSASDWIYAGGTSGTPFDEAIADWDSPNGPSSVTLYLGRLSAGQSLTITLEVRADVAGQSDCGTEHTGFPGSNQYLLHCMGLHETVNLKGGANSAPVAFTLYSRAPPP